MSNKHILKFTEADHEFPVYVMPDAIASFYAKGGVTVITLVNGHEHNVSASPDKIVAALRSGFGYGETDLK